MKIPKQRVVLIDGPARGLRTRMDRRASRMLVPAAGFILVYVRTGPGSKRLTNAEGFHV